MEGLYHVCTSSEFDIDLAKLKLRWNEKEIEERRSKKMSLTPKFYNYLKKTKWELFTVIVGNFLE